MWNGRVEDPPPSFTDILRRAVELHEAGAPTDTFAVRGGVVHPARKHLYPLTSIASCAACSRVDGLPLDPWLRCTCG